METAISYVVLCMREYQKQNNVKNQCISNAQYLYDFIKVNTTHDVKTKAVIVYSHNDQEDSTTIICGHLVIVLEDGTIIEPSYDAFNLKNRLYFDDVEDLLNFFDNRSGFESKVDVKKFMCDHVRFVKMSEQINGGKLLVSNGEHYNKQADHIEKLVKKLVCGK